MQMQEKAWRLLTLPAMIMLVALALSACSAFGGAEATVNIPEVAITQSDSGYDIAAEVPSGVVALKAPIDAHFMTVRLNEGVTLAQLNEALTSPTRWRRLPWSASWAVAPTPATAAP